MLFPEGLTIAALDRILYSRHGYAQGFQGGEEDEKSLSAAESVGKDTIPAWIIREVVFLFFPLHVNKHLHISEAVGFIKIEKKRWGKLIETMIYPIVHWYMMNDPAAWLDEADRILQKGNAIETVLHCSAIIDKVVAAMEVCRHRLVEVENMGGTFVWIIINALHAGITQHVGEQGVLMDGLL